MTPYEMLGGRDAVLALAETFYDKMESEPELLAIHELDAHGKVSRRSRDRFGLFLIGWLGGPQDYMAQHGHPRLRMRHGKVAIDEAMRDRWLHTMQAAMDARAITGDARKFLDQRFSEVANFLRNV